MKQLHDLVRPLGFCVLSLLAGASSAAPAQAPASAAGSDGRAVFVRALVTAQAQGGMARALAAKDLIHQRETLRTGPQAMARFVMRDRTMLAMKPDTVIVLSEYRFKDGGKDTMVTDVVSGGLRALTGLVDKRDPHTVALNTPMATIGVRGTAIRIEVRPGHEEVVFDYGSGWVENDGGRVEVKQGWGARVVSATVRPELFEAGSASGTLTPEREAAALLALEPRQARERARELTERMDPADIVVLVAMLEQVPSSGPREPLVLAIVDGLLAGPDPLDDAVLRTAVAIDPRRAPPLLGRAIESGVAGPHALEVVLAELLQPAPTPRGVPDGGATGASPGDAAQVPVAIGDPAAPGATGTGASPGGTPGQSPAGGPGEPQGQPPAGSVGAGTAVPSAPAAPRVTGTGLTPTDPALFDAVIDRAEELGIPPSTIDEVLQGIRQSTPCP